MLHWLLYPLADEFFAFNVFRYITFRSLGAAVTAFLIGVLAGPWVIERLRRMKYGQQVRTDGPQTHMVKQGTPTMGGILILGAIFVAVLLWARLDSEKIWLVLFTTAGFGFIGFYDDWLKISKRNTKGLSGKLRLAGEFAVAGAVGWWVWSHGISTEMSFPFIKEFRPEIGILYIGVGMVVIVGAADAVNLTDGLDGLAIGPIIICSATYALLAYLTGHQKIAEYLQLPFIPGAGELAVIGSAAAGAGLAFLWFNCHPALVFMGDVGALALGALIGTISVLAKHEILLVIAGGIFVVETVSVMMQVSYFKMTGGKRIFRMAPLHHHFEQIGWPETRVTVRFWIISIILALLSLSTLKLR